MAADFTKEILDATLRNDTESIFRYFKLEREEATCKYTPILLACNRQRLFLVEYFLRNGASLDSVFIKSTKIGDLYLSPLYIACDTQNIEIVKLLLAAGADPNGRANFFQTPLMIA